VLVGERVGSENVQAVLVAIDLNIHPPVARAAHSITRWLAPCACSVVEGSGIHGRGQHDLLPVEFDIVIDAPCLDNCRY